MDARERRRQAVSTPATRVEWLRGTEGLPRRWSYPLYRAGFRTVEEVRQADDLELLSLRGIGDLGVRRIREWLGSQRVAA